MAERVEEEGKALELRVAQALLHTENAHSTQLLRAQKTPLQSHTHAHTCANTAILFKIAPRCRHVIIIIIIIFQPLTI